MFGALLDIFSYDPYWGFSDSVEYEDDDSEEHPEDDDDDVSGERAHELEDFLRRHAEMRRISAPTMDQLARRSCDDGESEYGEECAIPDIQQASPSPERAFQPLSLTSVPLDVLYLVLSILHPSDLLHLCRTSKYLRQLLLSRQVSSVWKAAREARGNVPAPMPGVSESRWASWVFGEVYCEVCNDPSVLPCRDSFWLGRRVCNGCLKEKTVGTQNPLGHADISCYYSELKVYKLVPCIKVIFKEEGRRGANHLEEGCWFWARDIHDVSVKLTALAINVKAGKDGAKKSAQDYIKSRLELVRQHHQCVEDIRAWWNQDKTRVLQRNVEKLREHVVGLGLDWSEFEQLMNRHRLDRFIARLKARRTVIKDEELREEVDDTCIKAYIESREAERRAEAHAKVISDRVKILKAQYKSYMQRLPEHVQATAPCLGNVLDFPGIHAVINHPSSDSMSQDIPLAMHDIDAMIATWNQEKEQAYLSLFRQTNCCSSDGMTINPDPRILASSVVCCGNFGCLNRPPSSREAMIGWADAQKHQCFSRNPKFGGDDLGMKTRYQICYRGRDAVFSFLTLLALDPTVTLAADLDEMSPRFKCLCCPDPKDQPGKAARKAARKLAAGFGWREGVAHFFYHKKKSHPESKWKLVPAAAPETTVTPAAQGATTSARDASQNSRPDAIPKELCCMLCEGKKGERKFSEQGVRSHLSSVHSIGESVYGIHFGEHGA